MTQCYCEFYPCRRLSGWRVKGTNRTRNYRTRYIVHACMCNLLCENYARLVLHLQALMHDMYLCTLNDMYIYMYNVLHTHI